MDSSNEKEIGAIISNLRKKMVEIDEMTKELEKKRFNNIESNPTKTKKILEEIKVPSLDLLK